MDPPVVIGLNAVIVAVTEETPRILTVKRAEHSLAGELKSPPREFSRLNLRMQFPSAPSILPATARSNWDCAGGCANRQAWNLAMSSSCTHSETGTGTHPKAKEGPGSFRSPTWPWSGKANLRHGRRRLAGMVSVFPLGGLARGQAGRDRETHCAGSQQWIKAAPDAEDAAGKTGAKRYQLRDGGGSLGSRTRAGTL